MEKFSITRCMIWTKGDHGISKFIVISHIFNLYFIGHKLFGFNGGGGWGRGVFSGKPSKVHIVRI